MPEKFKHSRESFSAPGVQEDPVKTARRDNEVTESFAKDGKPMRTPELEQLLDKYDFDLIRQNFLRIAEKSGISPEKLNFVPRERIIEVNPLIHTGAYDFRNNMILLARANGPATFWVRSQEELDSETAEVFGSYEIKQLAMLVHEETHAVSRNICIWGQSDPRQADDDDPMSFNQSGFSQKHGSRDLLYVALNEGAVEKLARELTIDYLRQKGWSVDDRSVYEKSVNKNVFDSPYSFEVALVNNLVKRLALKNGQDEQSCWNAIVHALLNGESFEDKDVVQLFEESFGPDFLNDLSKIERSSPRYGPDDHTREFIKKYSL